jgi:hypothetical protein
MAIMYSIKNINLIDFHCFPSYNVLTRKCKSIQNSIMNRNFISQMSLILNKIILFFHRSHTNYMKLSFITKTNQKLQKRLMFSLNSNDIVFRYLANILSNYFLKSYLRRIVDHQMNWYEFCNLWPKF